MFLFTYYLLLFNNYWLIIIIYGLLFITDEGLTNIIMTVS